MSRSLIERRYSVPSQTAGSIAHFEHPVSWANIEEGEHLLLFVCQQHDPTREASSHAAGQRER
jgi:hypothetical protein